jgi:hypothetical protein
MAIAMGIGRDKWDVGDSGVDDGWLWIPNVMVLHLESRFGDRLSVGKSMWKARRTIPTSCLLTRETSAPPFIDGGDLRP